MEPWQSWAAFVLLSGGVGYYYYSTTKGTRRTSRVLPVPEGGEKKSFGRRAGGKGKDKAASGSEVGSGVTGNVSTAEDGALRKRKGKKFKKREAGLAESGNDSQDSYGAVVDQYFAGGDGEKVEDTAKGDEEFARAMAGLKSNKKGAENAKGRNGTTVGAGEGITSQPRKVRGEAPKPQTVVTKGGTSAETIPPTFDNSTTASSTTGADADDDLSPSASPFLNPTSSSNVAGRSPTAGGISDMLEAPTAGPSVLRLTEPTQPQRTSKPKPQSSPQKTETKKQRQNRKKAEALKAERQDAEQQRRVLLEKQLRTAREAGGRPVKMPQEYARNGGPDPSGLGQESSPWFGRSEGRGAENHRPTSGEAQGSGPAGSNSTAGTYLDTFEPEGASGTAESASTAGAKDRTATAHAGYTGRPTPGAQPVRTSNGSSPNPRNDGTGVLAEPAKYSESTTGRSRVPRRPGGFLSTAAADRSGPESLSDTNGRNGESSRGRAVRVDPSVPEWERDLPSEEEQIRMIKELNDEAGWNVVSVGKKGRRERGGTESGGS